MITETPRNLIRSAMEAKQNTTARAREAPTAARALAGILSKPRDL